jgi:hypothetical protein
VSAASAETITMKINVIFKEINDVEDRNKSSQGAIYIAQSELHI